MKLKLFWRNDMSNNLRKHILSQYISVNGENSENGGTFVLKEGPTGITENVEISDPDEIILFDSTQFAKNNDGSAEACVLMKMDPTYLTHAVEASDPDEFKLSEKTLETRVVESSDIDELQMGPTKNTFTTEASDEDDFLLM